jgi:hypothetical protein
MPLSCSCQVLPSRPDQRRSRWHDSEPVMRARWQPCGSLPLEAKSTLHRTRCGPQPAEKISHPDRQRRLIRVCFRFTHPGKSPTQPMHLVIPLHPWRRKSCPLFHFLSREKAARVSPRASPEFKTRCPTARPQGRNQTDGDDQDGELASPPAPPLGTPGRDARPYASGCPGGSAGG